MSRTRYANLSDAQLAKIDQLAAAFESARASGAGQSIEASLSDAQPGLQSALLAELLAIDIEARQQAGESPEPGDYLSRFDEDEEIVRAAFAGTTGIRQPAKDASGSNPVPTDTDAERDPTRIIAADETESLTRPAQAEGRRPQTVTAALPEHFGRYRIERLLGEGGMGAVYLARDTQLDRRVAIKIPKLDPRDVDGRERFLREARSMATVQHPNLCPIHDVGEIDGRTFLSMAYIDGRPLSRYLVKGSPVPEREAAAVVRKLALALDTAHQAGIVHRDLKPANVMIDRRHEPIVMDFGLAQRRVDGEATLTHEGAIVGSPAYMSPEQVEAEHHRIGPATDVYALGVLLFEMLCGRRPFEGSAASVLGKITQTEPPHPRELQPDLDHAIEAICRKAMAKQFENRIQSAGHLAELLGAWLQGQSVDVDADWHRAVDDDEAEDSPNGTPVSGDPLAATVSLPRLGDESEHSQLNFADTAQGVTDELAGAFFAARKTTATSEADEHSPSTISPDTTVRLQGASRRSTVRIGVVAMLVAAAALVVYTIRTRTADVTVTHPAGADVRVELRQNGEVVKVIGPDSGWQASVDAGTYQISLKPVDGDADNPVAFQLQGDGTLVVSKGDKNEVVIVSRPRVGPSATTSITVDQQATGDAALDKPKHRLLPQEAVPARTSTGEFVDSGQSLGESGSYCVAAGDMDGDGDIDAVVANRNGDETNRVWLNDGKGVFSEGHAFAQLESSAVALGDIDDDGDLDVVVSHHSDPGATLWLNDGKGALTDSGQRTDAPAQSVALGDIDDDGDLDAVFGCMRGNRVWFNDGKGLMQLDPDQQLGTLFTDDIALGDFDRDGDLDIFACNRSEPTAGAPNRLWWNDGHGKFSNSGQSLGTGASRRVAVADIDGDGDLDAATSNYQGTNSIWMNDGTGRLDPLEFEQLPLPSTAVALADLTGDGYCDALFASATMAVHGPLRIVRIEPSGKTSTRWSGNEIAWDMAVADFDGDGDLDAFVANAARSPNRVLLNRDSEDAESGDWPIQMTTSDPHIRRANSADVTLADFDGDGDLDAAVAGYGVDPCRVWLNDGEGRFTDSGSPLERLRAFACAVGDIDGDGDLDVYFADRDGPDHVCINDGRGTFAISKQRPNRARAEDVALGDLDGDGDLDVFVANWDTRDHIWWNDGHGVFSDSDQQFGDLRSNAVALNDIDGDGDLDVVVGGSDASYIAVNDGTGQFREQPIGEPQQASLTSCKYLAVGDLNGDGQPDLVLATNTVGSGSRRVWLNNGNAEFTPTSQRLWILPSRHVALADMDNDGDLDLFCSNGGTIGQPGLPDGLWLNDGTGHFSGPIRWIGNAHTNATALGDLDGNGYLDAYMATDGRKPDRVWLTTPAPRFTTAPGSP